MAETPTTRIPTTRLAGALAVALTLATTLAPAALAGAKAETLVLTGSSTVAPLAAEIGKRFETLHPEMRINVQTGGSSRGVLDARQGTADIGMVSRSLKEAEKDLLAFPIGYDGVGLIVHASNPITSLSDAQVAAIYTGEVTNWSQVGGRDAPITVVNKAEGRSTLELFLHYFRLDNTSVKAHIIIGDNEQGLKTVAGNADAIGYVSIGAAEYDAAHGIAIKLLPVGGVEASSENVAKGSFPISRPLNLVTRAEPHGLARMFIDFARSAKVHDIVRQQYFVPADQ